MPPRRSHHAPYFSGRVHDPIEDFLSEYEELAHSCDLTDRQKVETIIRYIPLHLRDLWKSLDGYSAHDWTDFRLALEEIYGSPSAPSRHTEQKLLDFMRYSSKSCMNDEEDVLSYYRQFLVLSKPLLDSQRLSTDKRNKVFWLGFHPCDRAEMYARLIAMHPDWPSSLHFDYRDVYKMAKAAFSGNHLLDVELDDPWDEPQSLRRRRSERAQERWLEQEEHDPRGTDHRYRTYEHQRTTSLIDCMPCESCYRPSDTRLSPLPEAKTKGVRLKEPTREEEDRELEDLVKRMYRLPDTMRHTRYYMHGAPTDFPTSHNICPSLYSLGMRPRPLLP
jgi:hypothetical protein